MVFARETSDSLTSLVKKIDEATGKNKSMGSFVVFLGDQDEKKLATLAEKEKINKTILTIEANQAGPRGYGISKDADITVIFYKNKTVKANHAFKKGNFTNKEVDEVLKDLPKILED